MFKSYLITALRNLVRDKYYAAINILGLTVALACCLVLSLYLRHELTYDQHNLDHERIYRMVNLLNTNGFIEDFAQTPSLVGPLMQRDHPQVQDFVRFQDLSPTLFRGGELAFYQDSVVFADANIFDVFTHEVVAGDPQTALLDPLSIAVSESFARAYFGGSDPIGRTLSTETSSYEITLVFADLPENTHLKYDALLSMNRLAPPALTDLGSQRAEDALGNTNTYTYLLLPEDYRVEEFESISTDFWERYMADRRPDSTHHDYYLEPLADIHLRSTTIGDLPKGNISFVYALAAVGLFLLLVASINYMNLATARATRRAREVAMRKLLGSGKRQLVLQFLSESLFFACLAIPLSLILAEFVISSTPVGSLLGMTISSGALIAPGMLAVLITMAVLLGILSGLYPAWFLSAALPISVSSVSRESKKHLSITRHGLVLIQFAISIGIIACTLLMYSQVEYFYNKPLGFEKENKLVLRLRGNEIIEQLDAVKDSLLQNPQILGITTSNAVPGGGFSISAGPVQNEDGSTEDRVFNVYRVGEEYFDVMAMEIVAGRDFSPSIPTDVDNSLIVNEAAVATLGWSDPLGKLVFNRPVVGVVKDFNYHELGRVIEPLALAYDPAADRSNYLTISISGESEQETLQYVQSVWEQFDPERPFEYQFLDSTLTGLYESEQRSMSLLAIFSALCIFISCLGLSGLTAYTTEQRSKEIGIRKILGATSVQLILMLFRNVFIVVIAGAAIASLISYVIMNRWLQGFAYHVEIELSIFVVATGVCVVVAFITMATQSWRTSRTNPVEALRYE